jgi:hypothetical protein
MAAAAAFARIGGINGPAVGIDRHDYLAFIPALAGLNYRAGR